ncbi:MAG: YraN family protein, partial [candidate division NC10 bacterium]
MDPRRSVGKRGEEEAARFLQKRGFIILDRNVRSRLGEIDLVARDGKALVFVE